MNQFEAEYAGRELIETCGILSREIEQRIPSNRARSVALTKVDEARLWCLEALRLETTPYDPDQET